MTDEMLAELMAVVGMANQTNALANGFQVELDEASKTADARPEGDCPRHFSIILRDIGSGI